MTEHRRRSACRCPASFSAPAAARTAPDRPCELGPPPRDAVLAVVLFDAEDGVGEALVVMVRADVGMEVSCAVDAEGVPGEV